MAERELAILLRARDQASKTIGGVEKKVSGLGHTAGKLGGALKTASVVGGAALGGVLVGGIVSGIRSLDELQRVQAQTNAVIKSTKGAAGISATAVQQYASDLENLTTVDDKQIASAENLLLTFTGIGKDVFPGATKAVVDLGIAMAGGDVNNANFKASAIQVGKALNDPIKGVTALSKVGVSFTKQQRDQIKALVASGHTMDAQKIILKELNTEFGQAGKAAGTGPGAAWRRLQDVGEDLSQALARGLLPSLVKVSNWLSGKLADPSVAKTLEDIGNALGDVVDRGLGMLDKVDLSTITQGLGQARDVAKTIVQTFLSLPPWVQTAIVTGWGLNKLTGGAVGDLVGELGKGLIKGVLGMTAGVVNISAGVVNGGGGPGLPGGPGGGPGGTLRTLANVVQNVAIVGITAEVAALLSPAVNQAGVDIHDTVFGKGSGFLGTGFQINPSEMEWPFGTKRPAWLPTNLASSPLGEALGIKPDRQHGGVTSGSFADDPAVASAFTGMADADRRSEGALNAMADSLPTKTAFAVGGAVTNALSPISRQLSADLHRAMRGDVAAAHRAAREMTADKGHGNRDQSHALLTALRTLRGAAQRRGDRAEVRLLSGDIARIGRVTAHRDLVDRQIRQAQTIARSSASTSQKLSRLHALEREMGRDDVHAINRLHGIIRSLNPTISRGAARTAAATRGAAMLAQSRVSAAVNRNAARTSGAVRVLTGDTRSEAATTRRSINATTRTIQQKRFTASVTITPAPIRLIADGRVLAETSARFQSRSRPT
jgi:hypothetical protein